MGLWAGFRCLRQNPDLFRILAFLWGPILSASLPMEGPGTAGHFLSEYASDSALLSDSPSMQFGGQRVRSYQEVAIDFKHQPVGCI